MLRKWEWIARGCRELELEHCEKLAKEIDKILCETIGFFHTTAWEEDYDDLERDWDEADDIEEKLFLLKDVADRTAYCTGCQTTEEDCDNCPFGRVAGKCADLKEPNKFDDFLEALREAMYES